MHRASVLSFCRRTLRSREEAEDVAQQTFLSAYTDLLKGVQPKNQKAWLYGIARNRCLEVLRARQRPGMLFNHSIADLTEEIERRAELRELLDDLKQLPYAQRVALGLFGLGQVSHADIAHFLGCKPEKVKALIFQARAALLADREARELTYARNGDALSAARSGAAVD